MQFNYSWSDDSNSSGLDPGQQTLSRGQNYTPLPPLTANSNATYLQFIDTVDKVYTGTHPDVEFRPFGDKNEYMPDQGYIIYSLVTSDPKENNLKPRVKEIVEHPENPDKRLVIFTQSFLNSVKFTAVHQKPRIAEEIIEDFEDFMISMGPLLKEVGVEECIYARRASDEHKTKYGEDFAARSLVYFVTTQKIITSDISRLKEVYIQVTAPRFDQDWPQAATPDTAKVHVDLYDTHATPNSGGYNYGL